MAFCSNCGGENPQGVRFCGKCGKPVGQVAHGSSQSPQAPAKGARPNAASVKGLIGASSCLFVLAAFTTVVMFFRVAASIALMAAAINFCFGAAVQVAYKAYTSNNVDQAKMICWIAGAIAGVLSLSGLASNPLAFISLVGGILACAAGWMMNQESR